ncbi:MAG TPA: DUF4190 domain-containing protein, partial [Acidimicrobiales bacterium]|nr:DUF4190 domain-containing protein [Acidimicrobiales bacterium]
MTTPDGWGQPPPPPPGGQGPPPGQWGYGPGGPGGPVPGYGPPQSTNGLAIASLVLGILWIYWIGSVLALVFGYVAKTQIKQRNQAGNGLATAGIVLGWVGIAF